MKQISVHGFPSISSYGQIEGDEAKKLTYFTYYQIHAFLQADLNCGLTKADFADVFYHNAAKLLEPE